MKLGRQGDAGAHGAPRISVLFEMNKETFPEASDWERAGSEFLFFKKKKSLGTRQGAQWIESPYLASVRTRVRVSRTHVNTECV